jgi:hypothetical protein
MQRVKARAVSLFFVLSVLLGVSLIAAGAFLVGSVVGLMVSGALALITGHWLTFLYMKAGA